MIDFQEMVNEHNKRVKQITQNPSIEVMKTLQNLPSIQVIKNLEKSPMFELAEKLKKIPAIEAAKVFQDSPVIEAVERLKLSPAIEAAKKLKAVTHYWSDILKERELTLEELAEFLSDLNYPPISTDISTSLLQDLNERLKEAKDSEKVEVLDSFIIRLFNDENVEEKLSEWIELECLKDRIHIISEIVQAHKHKLFSLSTLAIFPQIEGILAETFPELRSQAGKFTGHHQRKSLEEIFDNHPDKFNSIWSDYYDDNILNGFEHLKPIEYLSRHALAHGADKDYGTIVNSTKSLMIFDYIINKIELYRMT